MAKLKFLRGSKENYDPVVFKDYVYFALDSHEIIVDGNSYGGASGEVSLDTIINLLDVHLMFDEIESGRFEGWSRWAKNLYYAIPTVKNLDRLYQMLFKGDTSLFLPYID